MTCAYSRLVVGHATWDHLRTEFVTCAFDIANWRRRPAPGTIFHSDHGSQYVAWAFGRRLREAGLLSSMGSVGDALDLAVAESFFAFMQTELLNRRRIWGSRTQLANATFEWIEVFSDRQRRHSTLDNKSPVDYDRTRPTAPAVAARKPNPSCLLNGGAPQRKKGGNEAGGSLAGLHSKYSHFGQLVCPNSIGKRQEPELALGSGFSSRVSAKAN